MTGPLLAIRPHRPARWPILLSITVASLVGASLGLLACMYLGVPVSVDGTMAGFTGGWLVLAWWRWWAGWRW